jgi:osmoprotectant transport system permease protein
MINDVVDWFTDPASWSGEDGIANRLLEHSLLTVAAILVSLAVGLPLALWLGHRRTGGTALVNLANVGRAIPIVALLSLFSLGFIGSGDFGPFGRAGLATLVTLALFALPPIVTSTHVGISEVDPELVEVARGMGMSEGEILRKVEMPLARPMIVSGIRLAVVQVWATATIAALVAGPGLGRIIVHGYDADRPSEIIGASIVVAVIALVLELLLAGAQRVSDPIPAGGR